LARRFIRVLARGCKVRVKLGSQHRPSRLCRIWGRSKTHRRSSRRVRDSRRLGKPPTGAADGARNRGYPETHRRRSRKMQNPGRPGDSSTGDAGGARTRGNPELHAARTAEGCGTRGNSKNASPAQPED